MAGDMQQVLDALLVLANLVAGQNQRLAHARRVKTMLVNAPGPGLADDRVEVRARGRKSPFAGYLHHRADVFVLSRLHGLSPGASSRAEVPVAWWRRACSCNCK